MPETQFNIGDVLAIDDSVVRSTGGDAFGITSTGFVPKSFARLVAEKMATAQRLFGDDVDLTSGSVIRKVIELSALEDARLWASMGSLYDNGYVVSASGDALSRLGEDLGFPRPFMQATGKVKLKLAQALPPGYPKLTIPRGARLSTPGGHPVALDESVELSSVGDEREAAAIAFYPGPDHNLDPAQPNQKVDRWNYEDVALNELKAAEDAAGKTLIQITHTLKFSGGEMQWPDLRYRQLLLRVPRSIWTVDAIELAISLVPGVRQVQVFDGRGGLDINQSIFGNFNFIERLFSADRDLGSPYYFSVLVAPTPAAIWDGPDGLKVHVESAMDDLRPIGIFPAIQQAAEVGIGVSAKLVVKGIPLPSGSKATINASGAAKELRARIYARLRRYIDEIPFGEPVRASEVTWTIMNEPGVVDVADLKLLRYPANFTSLNLDVASASIVIAESACGLNVTLQANEIPVFVDLDQPVRLEIQ